MKIIYLGSFPTSRLINESNGEIDSLYRDDQNLIKGLRTSHDVEVYTIPDVPSFPSKKIYIGGHYDTQDNVHLLPLVNIPLIKLVWTIALLLIVLLKKKKKNESTVIFVPYIVFHHVVPAYLAKCIIGRYVSIVTVVPDIFFPERQIPKYLNCISERLTRKSDGFVFYTKAMSDYLSVKDKPHVVIEGFKDFHLPTVISHDRDKFIVTYTGSLNLNYGIGRLVDSMQFITNEDIELHLYGAGSGVEYIKNASIKDNRIKYFGLVPKEKSNEAMYSADVLVNPRNGTDGEYVAYSFPSKDIDYLGSGIPCVLCKLPGMPKEYYGYFEDAGKGSAQELADAILNIYNMAPGERKCKAKNAQIFITERMDCMNQGKKIFEMLKQL